MLHYLRLARVRGAKRTVPVLDLGRKTLSDSADIVKFANSFATPDRDLYPASIPRAEIDALEAELAERYGVETRRVAYPWFFRMGETALRYNDGKAPNWQRKVIRFSFPFAKGFLEKRMNISPETVARGRDRIEAQWEKIEKQLSDGRRYLFGDRITAADITFCALSAPEFLPDNYGGIEFPKLHELPPDIAEQIQTNRARPVGQFVLRVYREDRRA